MKITNFAKSAGIGGIFVLLTAGASMAAVATASVNVRTGPSTGYRVVDTLRPGEQVAIIDRDGSWCAIEKTGPNGWVACSYLSSSSSTRIYRAEPSVSLSFGFGTPRMSHDEHGGHWDNNGGHWSNNGGWDNGGRWDRPSRPSSSFGFSFSN